MKTIFMGTPAFALPTLNQLLRSGHTVEAVVTQPDRPKGRGRALAPPPVKERAQAEGLTVLQPEKASAPDFVERLALLEPDVIVVVAFGQLLKENLLNLPKRLCMNVHASLLPKYRGAAPINWAIINGETETGVTTMKMDIGLDTGDMLLKKAVPIGPQDTAQDIHDLLSEAGGALAVETLDCLEAGTLMPIRQNNDEATLAPKLKKEDGFLDWQQEAQALHNRVRGLEPWPGAFTFLHGKRLRIGATEVAPAEADDTPGVVVRVSDYGLEVGTGGGRLIIRELQPEGKKRMAVKQYLAGHPMQAGERFDAAPPETSN